MVFDGVIGATFERISNLGPLVLLENVVDEEDPLLLLGPALLLD